MELRHLEYFLMLSNELHFTNAAEKLRISQPTLSHQIKLLEKEIGFPLFNRVGKKVELTNIGEIVQQEALNIQASIQNIHNRIIATSKLEIGHLKIAVLPGELTDLVSTICIQFHQLYPNIKLSIETTDQIEQSLLNNRADFGIGFPLLQKEWLQATKIYEEEFYVISNHPNAERAVSLASIINKPLILFSNSHQCRKLLNTVSTENNLHLDPLVETSSISAILNLVRNGVGYSIVSRTLFEFCDTHDLHFQVIEKPHVKRNVHVLMKKDCAINFAASEFLKLLIVEIEKLQFNINTQFKFIFK